MGSRSHSTSAFITWGIVILTLSQVVSATTVADSTSFVTSQATTPQGPMTQSDSGQSGHSILMTSPQTTTQGGGAASSAGLVGGLVAFFVVLIIVVLLVVAWWIFVQRKKQSHDLPSEAVEVNQPTFRALETWENALNSKDQESQSGKKVNYKTPEFIVEGSTNDSIHRENYGRLHNDTNTTNSSSTPSNTRPQSSEFENPTFEMELEGFIKNALYSRQDSTEDHVDIEHSIVNSNDDVIKSTSPSSTDQNVSISEIEFMDRELKNANSEFNESKLNDTNSEFLDRNLIDAKLEFLDSDPELESSECIDSQLKDASNGFIDAQINDPCCEEHDLLTHQQASGIAPSEDEDNRTSLKEDYDNPAFEMNEDDDSGDGDGGGGGDGDGYGGGGDGGGSNSVDSATENDQLNDDNDEITDNIRFEATLSSTEAELS